MSVLARAGQSASAQAAWRVFRRPFFQIQLFASRG
ncbi:hypothetical protein GGD41_003236 [Paraburkholderia bryophila]|uniref:Uncharacterized protein n=1 Tax=Paraburkholderia bryophila TaxID=420952 RepID=A0A7Z0B0M3_9BURK|nr:hypothetical protein [Paraburkholderia bryophila]